MTRSSEFIRYKLGCEFIRNSVQSKKASHCWLAFLPCSLNLSLQNPGESSSNSNPKSNDQI